MGRRATSFAGSQDNVSVASEPFMGAKYHTAHHVYYSCNYGQFFTFWDKFYGTLRVPGETRRVKQA